MTNGDLNLEPDAPSAPNPAPVVPDEQRTPSAWQPLTPRGVAAFASATLGRLFLVQFVVALIAAGAVLWFVAKAWFPTIREAIHQLPEQGEIRGQQLVSPRASSEPLAAGHFLAIIVDLENRNSASPSSDVRLRFHRWGFELCSLPGCLASAYPKGWAVEFNRTELEPWWGAWEPILLGLSAILVILWLMLNWIFLAACWFCLARLVAYFGDRELTWGGSWRLASAALMPGALLLIAAICLYGLRAVDLILLGVVAAVHLMVGLVYACVSPLWLPRLPSVQIRRTRNPFAAPPTAGESTDEPGPGPS